MKTLVIVPTYNERENLRSLAEAILRQDRRLDLLVVDDASPDGTGALADELAVADSRVRVLHRPAKLGIGTAHIEGFRAGLRGGYAAIVTMDADFSHNPDHLPAILASLEEADVVLGCRYMPGGGVRNWGVGRRMLSWTANACARAVVGLPTHDNTGGFRGYRRQVLEGIRLEDIRTHGYGFLVEMLDLCVRSGARVCETPILFEDRRAGRSKISKEEILLAVWTLARIVATRGRIHGAAPPVPARLPAQGIGGAAGSRAPGGRSRPDGAARVS